MKLKIRFTTFFIVGLFGFILYLGIIMALIFDGFFPYLGFEHADDNVILFLIIFSFCFITASAIFGHYFVNPILYIISFIKNVSADNKIERKNEESCMDFSKTNKELFNKQGQLRWRYLLYEEVILDLHKLSEDLEKAKFERKELETAKKNWIRGVSHDLKTPLSYVVGYSGLLLNEEYTWNKEEQSDFLNIINEKGKYIEALIGDFNLSFQLNEGDAKVPLTRSSFELVSSMKNLIADISNHPKAVHYDFSFNSSEPVFMVLADQKLLNRMFENLIMNAVLHNEEGTKISVSVTKTKNQHVRIAISDNGNGLENNERHPLLGDCGWGFGLTVVKNIVEAHNGSADFERKQNVGTSCYIDLPILSTKTEN